MAQQSNQQNSISAGGEPTYGIRTPLSDSFLDETISLSDSESGFQIHRQFTLGTLLFTLLSLVIFMFVITRGPFLHGGVSGLGTFTLGYFWMSVLLISPTPTHLYGLQLVIPMIKYALGDNRKVYTSQVSSSNDFRNLTGIKSIHDQDDYGRGTALIHFTDDEYGELIAINGSASTMTFESDKQNILNDVNRFYKQLTPSVKITFDSVVSPQRVTRQLHDKDWELDHMILRGTPLENLMKQKRYVLKNYVGNEFKSWHQYMLVRSPSLSDIRNINEFLIDDLNGEHLFVNNYRILRKKDIINYLKRLYGDDVSNLPDFVEE